MIRKEPPLTGKPFTALEKIPTTVCVDDVEAALFVAGIIAETIREHNNRNKSTVLGLATGHTQLGVYHELIRLHRQEGLDFSRVVTFNLDEYHPMPSDRIQSYRRWMQENFFYGVNIPAANIHIPDGTIPASEIEDHCQAYEQAIAAAGGIDIQLLGIGRTGHIGFNEPGSSRDSETRLISLDPTTRLDAAADFFGESNVPRQAITMGVGTILKARQVLLMALGEQKAPIIRKSVEGPITNSVAASFLQQHPNAKVITDLAAGAELTRVATPWLLGEIEWSEENRYRAVIWLSLQTGKSVLKLDQDDYDRHHLASLVRTAGSADELNRSVFNRMFKTIAHYGLLPRGKCTLCFSPHPDDDAISMGATHRRLVQRENQVYVAYMTSGNIAVFDDDTLRMMELWVDLNALFGYNAAQIGAFEEKVRRFLESKEPGSVDIPEVQQIKTQIRRSEAIAACRWLGIPRKNAFFLDLPFYQTGQVRKRPIGAQDVEIVLKLIRQLKPYWIFMAGELSDPHGTHRICADVVFAALKQCPPQERPAAVWLYRGAWQEWDPDAIDMAVPLSKSELMHKIFGIYKHESQKDKALFPGPYDDREFWQRAEARNTKTAETYNQLGLPEYHAMEAFVRYDDY